MMPMLPKQRAQRPKRHAWLSQSAQMNVGPLAATKHRGERRRGKTAISSAHVGQKIRCAYSFHWQTACCFEDKRPCRKLFVCHIQRVTSVCFWEVLECYVRICFLWILKFGPEVCTVRSDECWKDSVNWHCVETVFHVCITCFVHISEEEKDNTGATSITNTEGVSIVFIYRPIESYYRTNNFRHV